MNDIQEECRSENYMTDTLNMAVFIKEEPLVTSHNIKEEIDSIDNDKLTESIVHISSVKEETYGRFNFVDVKCEPCTSSQNFYCESCEGVCLGFCSNCQIPTSILNGNIQRGSEDGVANTLPKNILQIRNSLTYAEGVFTLVNIPEGITFGPSGGLKQTQQEVGFALKLKGAKFVNAENAEDSNWTQLVNCAKNVAEQNLDIFQYDGRLYYRSIRQINKGEELFVYYGEEHAQNDDTKNDSYYYPPLEKHLEDVYACTFCCLGFRSKAQLMQHRIRCTQANLTSFCLDDIIQCSYCNIYLNEVEYLRFHMDCCSENHSRKGMVDIRTQQSVPGMSKNPMEIESCVKQDPLCTVGKKYSCSSCAYGTNYKFLLDRHSCVSGSNGHLTEEKPFECEICKRRFKRKPDLVVHMRVHSGEKPFECKTCKRRFTQLSSLRSHMRTHSGERPFRCEICDRSFGVRSSLNKHLATHTGEKPYECEICKKCFAQQPQLVAHMCIHTGEKAFACDICKKCFGFRSSLSKHLLTHTGEKPYECEICKKRFTQQSTLKRHVQIHTGEKPFECEICKKCFGQLGTLKIHLLTHMGKPLECEICNEYFTHKAQRTVHMRFHIGEKPVL